MKKPHAPPLCGSLPPPKGLIRLGAARRRIGFSADAVCQPLNFAAVAATRWPNSCKGNFTPQERLLEYLFFNIASCVNAPG